ncbi:MAG: TraB/GumN family protein [Methanomassiliicoccaceae archaeon]|nr:TraB/GumN family protein [Methanomassiliicoccaceae archaeon]
MITLIGTGHVFRIAEPVAFIIRNIWPDAVLVELDETRYNAMMRPARSEDDAPRDGGGDTWAYRNMAKYQRETAKEHDSQMGAEFIAAIDTGRTIGAAIELIDTDANKTMSDIWKEMPFLERMRFTFSMIGDRFRKKKAADDAIERFSEDEDTYFEGMRKKYPTLVRKLIDERNVHMAGKIKEAAEKYDNVVAVIGDGHVGGIAALLGEDANVRKIRLRTLMDAESMNILRAELWSGAGEEERG